VAVVVSVVVLRSVVVFVVVLSTVVVFVVVLKSVWVEVFGNCQIFHSHTTEHRRGNSPPGPFWSWSLFLELEHEELLPC
jgi:hypothetical protein